MQDPHGHPSPEFVPEATRPGLPLAADAAGRSPFRSRLRILHLEDDPRDARLIREILEEGEVPAEVTVAAGGRDFTAGLERETYDLILADYRLPSFDGLEALRLARSRCPETPFIFVTGALGEERAIETLRAGAVDYVLKDNLRRLPAAVRRAIAEAEDRAGRHHAEEQVALQKLAFQRLAENSPDIIMRLDPEHRFVYANPAVEKVLGIAPSVCLGKRAAELGVAEPVAAVWDATLERVFSGGEPAVLETAHPEQGEASRQYHLVVAPEFGADGHVESALAIARDVTEAKEVENALRRANAALAEADRQKDEFLAMMAHELRNPLTPIRFAVHVLAHPTAGRSDRQRQADIIDRQVSHMARLLDELLDVSRITRGKITLERKRLDLRDVVRRALESCRPVLLERRIALTYSPADEPLCLDGDPARLEQVVRNLLDNAIKFSEDEGRIRITLGRETEQVAAPPVPPATARPEAPMARLRIADSGSGISADLLPRIFDLFSQGEQGIDRSRGGLGIGLTVVKRLVEMHGGSVRAESAGAAQGATFTLLLPLGPGDC